MSVQSTSQPASRLIAPALQRAAFVALLAVAVIVPKVWIALSFPSVFDAWSLLPFCGLVLVALFDVRRPLRLAHLDLIAFLSLVLAIAYAGAAHPWSMLLLYPQLFYLGARMLVLAGGGRRAPIALRAQLPARWLAGGTIVLVGVHIAWAAKHGVLTDVGGDSVLGAKHILHGLSLYGGPPGQATYGPANFLAYIPFAALFRNLNSATRAATVVFTLLTAVLLFELGRRRRGRDTGLLLAFCWLALPFTLYEDATAFNDSLVAATVVGGLLALEHPARRGAAVAIAGWTKLAPLALVPLLALRSGGMGLRRFVAGFVLTSAALFVPAFDHSTPGSFIAQSFGFQISRIAGNTLWAALGGAWARHAHWLVAVSAVAHGLVLGIAVAVALVLPRVRPINGLVEVAAATAGVLVLLELTLSYYAYSYILWFAPALLVALTLGEPAPAAPAPRVRGHAVRGVARGARRAALAAKPLA